MLALEREEARLRGMVGELTANRAEADGKVTEIDIEILKLGTGRREDAITQLRDLGYRELELAERRRSLGEKLDRLEIRAPVSGIVYGLTVTTPHSVIRPAEPMLYIVPQDRPLVISAQISPIHIDEVHAGQEVRIHFSAFNSRSTPELQGHVAVLSADAFRDDRTQRSYYRAQIEIDKGQLERLKGKTILPGMPVEAFIRTGDRSPMAYLLKPFKDYFNRAFRES